jgi:hypothetical protein
MAKQHHGSVASRRICCTIERALGLRVTLKRRIFRRWPIGGGSVEVLGVSARGREKLRYSKCCISWTSRKEFTLQEKGRNPILVSNISLYLSAGNATSGSHIDEGLTRQPNETLGYGCWHSRMSQRPTWQWTVLGSSSVKYFGTRRAR